MESQDEQALLSVHEWIYQSSSGLIDFVIVATELENLAEYGFSLINWSQDRATALEKELEEIKSGSPTRSYVDEDGDEVDTSFVELGVESDRYGWQEHIKFTTPAVLLVALHILCEKSLKTLCYSFSVGEGQYEIRAGDRFKVRVNAGESNLDAQLRYLIEECKFNFRLASDEKELLDRCRRLRNDFAHGDWANVRATIDTIPFERALRIVSKVFARIESGMP